MTRRPVLVVAAAVVWLGVALRLPRELALADTGNGVLKWLTPTSLPRANLLEGERALFQFSFVNAGSGRLYLSEVAGSCSCLHPLVTRLDYAAGEPGQIKGYFDSRGWPGNVSKELWVRTDNGQSFVLHLDYQVGPP